MDDAEPDDRSDADVKTDFADAVDAEKELSELQIRAYSALVEDIVVDGYPSRLLHIDNSQGVKLASKIRSIGLANSGI